MSCEFGGGTSGSCSTLKACVIILGAPLFLSSLFIHCTCGGAFLCFVVRAFVFCVVVFLCWSGGPSSAFGEGRLCQRAATSQDAQLFHRLRQGKAGQWLVDWLVDWLIG